MPFSSLCRSQMRCVRTQPAAAGPCDRCTHNGRSCFIPRPQKLGRKRGSAGRYQGVDRALRNLRLALKKGEGQTATEKSKTFEAVSELLNDETLTVSHGSSKDTPSQTSFMTVSSGNISDWTTDASRIAHPPYALENHGIQRAQDVPVSSRDPSNQRNIKSNPLWLIADASREALAAAASHRQSQTLPCRASSHLSEDAQPSSGNCLNMSRYLLNTLTCVPLGLKLDSQVLEEGLEAALTTPRRQSATLEYFKYRDVNRFPDTGPDLDPIEQGLVTIQEAQELFSMLASQTSFPRYLLTFADICSQLLPKSQSDHLCSRSKTAYR